MTKAITATATATNEIIINASDVIPLINAIKGGEFYSVVFERAAAKCPNCGKSNKKWNGLDVCPICGTPLSKERETLAQNGVHNPQNEAITPKGVGETTAEAKLDGRVKYYDPQIVNADGTRGGYRQFYAVNVKRMRISGKTYIVR
jgi:hypothetical protein